MCPPCNLPEKGGADPARTQFSLIVETAMPGGGARHDCDPKLAATESGATANQEKCHVQR